MSNVEQKIFINELLYNLHLCKLQANPNRIIDVKLINNDSIIMGMNTIKNKQNTIRYSDGEERTLELACSISHLTNPAPDAFPISIQLFDEDTKTTRIFRLKQVTHYSISPHHYSQS